MSGQMTNIDYKQRQEQLDNYVINNPPYKVEESGINWHGLSDYARDKNLSGDDITPELINDFKV